MRATASRHCKWREKFCETKKNEEIATLFIAARTDETKERQNLSSHFLRRVQICINLYGTAYVFVSRVS